jgi:hypothetical protein
MDLLICDPPGEKYPVLQRRKMGFRGRFQNGKKGYPAGAKNATIVAVYTVFQVSSWLLPPR